MFTSHIDLGQIITGGLITLIGSLLKRTIDKFEARIDSHDVKLYAISNDVSEIKGMIGTRKGDRNG